MLKYMLTVKCTRSCDYCITKNVKAKTDNNILKVIYSLIKLRLKGHKEIMFTGGEPTIAKHFVLKSLIAKVIFKGLYITTQNKGWLNTWQARMFNGITYSLHDIVKLPIIRQKVNVYGSCIDFQYYDNLAHDLQACGFSGLTINEEQRQGEKFKKELPILKEFSIRVNDKGKCLDEDIMLPNLSVINDFNVYL